MTAASDKREDRNEDREHRRPDSVVPTLEITGTTGTRSERLLRVGVRLGF